MDKKSKKRGLGRGLNALIGSNAPLMESEEIKSVAASKQESVQAAKVDAKEAPKQIEEKANGVQMVDIYKVEPDRQQPRKNFDDESMEELTASIVQYGVLQPLIVQKKDEFYQIIAGERRWRAAKNAGIEEIPVIIKEYSTEEMLEISLIENIQREDLSPVEEAQAYKRLMEEYHLNQEEIAEKVGKSRSAIANFLRLLRLEPSVQGLVAEGKLSAGHAKVLLSVDSKKQQKELAELIIARDLSVRQLEKLLQEAKKKEKEPETEDRVTQLIHEDLARRMCDILGTKVNIVSGKRKGKIEIEYYSPDDLERILDMINRIR